MIPLTTLIGSQNLLGLGLPPALIKLLQGHADYQSISQLLFRLILLGLVSSVIRPAYNYIQYLIVDIMYPTAYISHNDEAYEWVMSWLAQDPQAIRQMRHFELCTVDRENVKAKNHRLVSQTVKTATWTTPRIVGKLYPTYGGVIMIKHQGTTLWINRRSTGFARSRMAGKDHMTISTYVFQQHALKSFLVAAHEAMYQKEETELHIYHPFRIKPTWQIPVTRPGRPWSSVVLPGTMKEDIARDMERFFSEREVTWYGARGIPHRRGFMFHGAPGSGKTTLTTALASRLKLDIYTINPGQRGMDDAKLNKLFRDCPRRSIILIEDIDCVFTRNAGGHPGPMDEDEEGNPVQSIDMTMQEGSHGAEPTSPTQTQQAGGSHDLSPSTVSLSGLLNAIDGVSSQEGCILIASTNHIERLDAALCRAGRFDVKIAFHNAVPSQARDLFLHFYPIEDFLPAPDTESLPATPVKADPKDAKDTTDEKIHSRPTDGHTTQIEGLSTGLDLDKTTLGITSQADLGALADKFTRALFPLNGRSDAVGGKEGLEVSMAALQSYLLKHKDNPLTAVESAEEWAQSDAIQDWSKAKSFPGEGAGNGRRMASPRVGGRGHANGSGGAGGKALKQVNGVVTPRSNGARSSSVNGSNNKKMVKAAIQAGETGSDLDVEVDE